MLVDSQLVQSVKTVCLTITLMNYNIPANTIQKIEHTRNSNSTVTCHSEAESIWKYVERLMHIEHKQKLLDIL